MWLFDRRVGGHGGGETPGPIPNPEAKPTSADGTAPARVWESRTPPNTNPHNGAPQTTGLRSPIFYSGALFHIFSTGDCRRILAK